jgi:hypothetical protein
VKKIIPGKYILVKDGNYNLTVYMQECKNEEDLLDFILKKCKDLYVSKRQIFFLIKKGETYKSILNSIAHVNGDGCSYIQVYRIGEHKLISII